MRGHAGVIWSPAEDWQHMVEKASVEWLLLGMPYVIAKSSHEVDVHMWTCRYALTEV